MNVIVQDLRSKRKNEEELFAHRLTSLGITAITDSLSHEITFKADVRLVILNEQCYYLNRPLNRTLEDDGHPIVLIDGVRRKFPIANILQHDCSDEELMAALKKAVTK